jgi:Pyridine nucleotide-disulphide oxidoreductase
MCIFVDLMPPIQSKKTFHWRVMVGGLLRTNASWVWIAAAVATLFEWSETNPQHIVSAFRVSARIDQKRHAGSPTLLSSSNNWFQSWLEPPPSIKKVTAASSQKNIVPTANYDLIVIGGGVVGVTAALTASNSPYNIPNILLVDAPNESGALFVKGQDLSLGAPTGLFSKALRDTSKRINVASLQSMGLRSDSIWNEIVQNCLDLANQNAQDILRQLQQQTTNSSTLTYQQGLVKFMPTNTASSPCIMIESEGKVQYVTGTNILIATGSSPFKPASIPFDNERIFDSDS